MRKAPRQKDPKGVVFCDYLVTRMVDHCMLVAATSQPWSSVQTFLPKAMQFRMACLTVLSRLLLMRRRKTQPACFFILKSNSTPPNKIIWEPAGMSRISSSIQGLMMPLMYPKHGAVETHRGVQSLMCLRYLQCDPPS